MKIQLLFIIGIFSLLGACAEGPESPRGFSLPEGDAKRGEEVFITFECLACHTLKGFENKDTVGELDTFVALGGDVTQVKTYAELVTSVINPSHKIASGYQRDLVADENGKSKMRNYNDIMTVSQMVDLVAFLQPHYTIKPFNRTNYPNYFP